MHLRAVLNTERHAISVYVYVYKFNITTLYNLISKCDSAIM